MERRSTTLQMGQDSESDTGKSRACLIVGQSTSKPCAGNQSTPGPINKNAPQHRDSTSTMMAVSITALRISRKMVVKMTIKRLIPKMLLVAGLVLTILVSAPSRVLSDDPVKSKVQESSGSREALTEGGNYIGERITSTKAGVTTTTE